MDSTSKQAFDLDETESCFVVENYDENEFVDDELSENIELCLDEVDKIIEQSSGTLGSINDAMEPCTGMEFKSRDDAREFYIAYGRRAGFTVRIHHNRRSRINNMVIGQDFVCSKEGFREKKYVYRKDRVLPPPPVTREGCQAMLRLALKDGITWVVTKFIAEHNHELMSPSKVPWRGSAKSLVSEDEKDRRIRELTIELNNEKQRCKRNSASQTRVLTVLTNASWLQGLTYRRRCHGGDGCFWMPEKNFSYTGNNCENTGRSVNASE
ncbi:protein FAR1-RELATED SEQUENCE 11 isoform X1 [Populus alba]|uniref:protein FAR1-RELATED SEQUENCE 11 isoform X1 n=1 Tax=Populus alba TaxID=43335 RepID=UPI001588E87A|nr:protein FAR1-RELATED SEQUENCE 7-like isoform X1 [Populus alba]